MSPGLETVVIAAYAAVFIIYRLIRHITTPRRAADAVLMQAWHAYLDGVLRDSAGRCIECGCTLDADMVVNHVRLWHDWNRPRGPEDDPAFIAGLWRQES